MIKIFQTCNPVIELEVHQQLRAFLREQGQPYWAHHLTMGRLVARALRLGRSALIQTGVPPSGQHGRYRLSYLVPALLWQESAILVATEAVQQRLLMVEIPQIRQWVQTQKAIQTGDRWPHPDFQGLLITSPQAWLADRLHTQTAFPQNIPVILDEVDDLETWTRQQLTICINPQDWDHLMLAFPAQTEEIRDVRVQLTRAIFQHPINPYNTYLVDDLERELLQELLHRLLPGYSSLKTLVWNGLTDVQQAKDSHLVAHDSRTVTQWERRFPTLPAAWRHFWHRFELPDSLVWATVDRTHGQFSLHGGPVEVASALRSVWSQQPIVLIGNALDLETEAPTFRQQMALEDLTCLKFAPDRQHDCIQLYLPDGLPLPNTPQYQPALMQEVRSLLSQDLVIQGLTVLIVGDTPLRAQVGSVLAAEFGSRVQVERTCLDENGILVTGWEFWRQYQAVLPLPHLLVIATLPIPSLENPLVAGRVAYYKRQRRDWFRLYLLPHALSELQRAIAPIRESQGVVALLDSRVLRRSYGSQILEALSPLARINYLDRRFLSQSSSIEP